MAVSGINQIDFRDPKLIAFLNDVYKSNLPPPGPITIDPTEKLLPSRKFNGVAERSEPGYISEFNVVTAVKRQYRVYKDKQKIAEFFLTMPITFTVRLDMSTVLGVSNNLVHDAIAYLIQCFGEFNMLTDNLEEFAMKAINNYNATAVQLISSKDFDIFPKNVFSWLSATLHDEQEKWLFEVYYGNAKQIVPDFFPPGVEVQNMQGLGYEFRILGDQFLSKFIEEPPIQQMIGVPAGTLDDAAMAQQIVIDQALSAAQKDDCTVEQPIVIRITEIWYPDATKTEWVWEYYDTGCGGFHFFKPHTYTKKRRFVLYASVTFAQPEVRLKKIIQDALDEAGTSAIALFVSSAGSLTLAADVFFSTFWREIKENTKESIRCLNPEIYALIEDDGDWK